MASKWDCIDISAADKSTEQNSCEGQTQCLLLSLSVYVRK